MSGNGGRGAQRPTSRPPFLVIGLLVALSILGFNYWNLSSSYSTLTITKVDLEDQIRILTSKRLNEEQSKRDVERKYNLLEQRISVKDSEIKSLQQEMEVKKTETENAEKSKADCDSNLRTCETNNQGIQQQLEGVNKELEELKKKDTQPATQNCDKVCTEQKKKVFTDIFNKIGPAVMKQIIDVGIEVDESMKVAVQQAIGDKKQIQPPVQGDQKQDTAHPQGDQKQDVVQPPNVPANDQGKVSTTSGMMNTLLGLHDKLKQSVESLSKNGIIPMHDIINKTKEGVKEGLKKSQDLAGLIYGEGNKTHESTNTTKDKGIVKTSENDLKNDTLVGNKTLQSVAKPDNQPAGNNQPAVSDNKKPAVSDVKPVVNSLQSSNVLNGVPAKDNKDSDSRRTMAPAGTKIPHNDKQSKDKDKEDKDNDYEDEDEDAPKQPVEENKNLKFEAKENNDLKFEAKKTEDSIDALRRRMSN